MKKRESSAHPLYNILREFGRLEPPGNIEILYGGSHPIYRAGDIVLKRIRPTSLENNHSLELSAWISSFSNGLSQEGFRLPRPIQTANRQWITPHGWTAMSFVEGRPPHREEIPTCIAALESFHRATAHLPLHPRMRNNQTAWGKAHRWSLGEPPTTLQPELHPLVDHLYDLRRPVQGSAYQLIHGDPSHNNFLVAPDLAPAILDISPFWGSPDFSMAIFANFAGPRLNDPGVLDFFSHFPNFKQFLIRAALRMLLVVSALNGLGNWSTEKRAAEIVIEYVEGN